MMLIHLIENLDDNYGGPSRSVPLLVKDLEEQGLCQEIFTVRWSDNENNTIVNRLNLNVKKFKLIGSRKFSFSPSMLKALIIQRHSYENIHVHNHWNFIAICALIMTFFGKRVFITIRGSLDSGTKNSFAIKFYKAIFFILIIKPLLRRSTKIVTTSTCLLYGINTKKIEKVFNHLEGFSLQISHPKNEARGLMVLSVGRLNRHKRFESLIELASVNSNVILTLACLDEDMEYLDFLSNIIEYNNLESRVKIIRNANRHQLELLYLQSDVFISTSYSENFGIAIADSLLSGCYTIAPKASPWPDHISELPHLFISGPDIVDLETLLNEIEQRPLSTELRLEYSKYAENLLKSKVQTAELYV